LYRAKILKADEVNQEKVKNSGKAEIITGISITEILGDKTVSGLKYQEGGSGEIKELAVEGMLKNYLILRVCWMMGGGPAKDQKFVSKIINQIKEQKIPEIKAVTDQIGSPTYAKDLVNAAKKLIEEDAAGIYNLANKGVCSRYDVAKEIVNVLKPEMKVSPVKMSYFNLGAPRTFNEGLVSKIDIMRPWQEALREYLETEWKPFFYRKKLPAFCLLFEVHQYQQTYPVAVRLNLSFGQSIR